MYLFLICLLFLSAGCKKTDDKSLSQDNASIEGDGEGRKEEDMSNVDQEQVGTDQQGDNNNQVEATPNVYTLDIDGANVGIEISDMLYGLFYEDINFAADGGLYAEMIINRSFEFTDDLANNGALHGYSQVGEALLTVIGEEPLNENNPSYLHIENTSSESAGFRNKGFLEGLTLTSGEKYRFTVYLKSNDYKGNIIVNLLNNKGEAVASGTIAGITKDWVKYTLELEALSNAYAGSLEFVLEESGTVDVDMVSLFPFNTYKNRENGLRADLVELLEGLNPTFIRFPGGCIVEGHPLSNAYNWKDTIGDVAERKHNYNLWHNSKEYPYYQSYGLGFYEYFLLSEDLGAKPVPIVNCGMSCQARGNELADGAELQQYIQDALDLIEFANGDETTTWGAKRVAMGHKEPFNLEYLGVGNEQWEGNYFYRYTQFVEAIRAEYPEIKIITSSGPASDGGLYNFAWDTIKSHADDEVKYADLVDEHYYNSPDWFLANTNRYDSYDRDGVAVFVGEYAAKANTLKAAIAEAAYMTGLERNSDIVKMASYAPLFGNTTLSQWAPDMIWFNNSISYGSVNYYVQKMFANNVGDNILQSDLTQVSGENSMIIKGKVGVGTWATGAVYDDIKVVDNETGKVLYESDFENGDISEFKNTSQGDWEVYDEDGNKVYGQKNTTYPTNGEIMGSASYVGDNNWTNYTYTLRAKKVDGMEGFLIPFAVEDSENFYHWNIGGWNNTVTAVEQAQGGVKTTATNTVSMNIELNKWYDIKVVVTPTYIECYMNNVLLHTIELAETTPVYETTSIDKETGDIIIKVVNAAEEADVNITLDNVTLNGNTASCQVLTGKLAETNTMVKRENVVPVDSTIEVSEKFTYVAPAYSVSIIRIPTK